MAHPEEVTTRHIQQAADPRLRSRLGNSRTMVSVDFRSEPTPEFFA
jgi:hypothetical protein